MAFLPLRSVTLPGQAEAAYEAWLDDLESQLDAPGAAWSRVVRQTFLGLFHPEIPDWESALADHGRSHAARATLLALDPANVTLEPEYYADVDPVRFARVKPLLWLWYSFDRAPLAGQNVALGVALRRRLAPRIFARCGRNFKCFQHVEFSFGYNMDVGDDVVVHRHVLLDDRGERPGSMFADWELIGVPHRVTIGERGLKNGEVEYVQRRALQATMVPVGDVFGFIAQQIANVRA